MIRGDFRSEAVRRVVVMGESNAYGMCAGAPENEWVQVLAGAIRECQDQPVRVFNNAIPGNVISRGAACYAGREGDWSPKSGLPALERFEQDMIAYAPHLAAYAYGLNDSRCGHRLDSFVEAYKTIVTRTREALPQALIVLVGPYWNLQYDAEAWAAPQYAESAKGVFGRGGDDLVLPYNEAIADLASTAGALFVDVYHVLEGAPWLLHSDACHYNDIGQRPIGLAVFSRIAASCSFLARKSRSMEESLDLSIGNTGRTDALPQVISAWRRLEEWVRRR